MNVFVIVVALLAWFELNHRIDANKKRIRHMSNATDQLAAYAASIDAASNAIAADIAPIAAQLEALRAQLAAAPTVTQDVLDKLGASAARLDAAASTLGAMGAPPAAPAPTPADGASTGSST